jgi:HAD superfamily hydrolase (TIGR01509 family)
MLNELGLRVTLDDMFAQFVGLSMPQCVDRIAQMLGHAPPGDFVERLQVRTEAALKEGVEPMPGIRDVLDTLTLPFCVASSGSHRKIRLTLGTTGLLEYFDGRIFSAQDVVHPKPAPELFLLAANTLGHAPADCIVIEDSLTGVRAGVAAGMRVFGFSVHTPAQRLRAAGAHEVFRSLADLPALIRAAAAG